jgi:hypothetical protein
MPCESRIGWGRFLRSWSGGGWGIDAKAEVIAEDGEEADPILGDGIIELSTLLIGGADLEKHLVIGVLSFPKIQFGRDGPGDAGDFGGGGEVRDVVGIGGEVGHAAFEIGFGDVGDALPVEFDIAALAFVEECLEPGGVGRIRFELATEIGVEDEGGGGLKGGGEGGPQILEEPHERGIGIGDLAKAAFDVFVGGGENLVQNLALFITEQVLEGVTGLAEVAVHEADDLREIGTFERFAHFLDELLVGFGTLVDADTAVDVVIAEVKDTEAEDIGVAGDFEGDFGAADEEPGFTGDEFLPVLALASEGIDAGCIGIVFEEGADGVMGADFFAIDDGGPDKLFIDSTAVAIFGDVAAGLGESIQERGFEIEVKEIAGELEGAAGVLDDLDGFDAGDFVEEPAATGVHEHGVALEFEQTDGGDPFIRRERMMGMAMEEAPEIIGGTVKDDGDIIIAGGPWITKEFGAAGFEMGCELIAKPVEGLAEGASPMLIPTRTPAGVAGTVGLPASDSVGTTPGAGLMDFDLERGRMGGEEFAVIGQARELIGFDVLEGVGEGHFTVAMVMAVGFAVGGDMNKLIFRSIIDERIDETMGEAFTFDEKTFEGDSLRDRSVVEEDDNLAVAWQAHEVGYLRIDAAAVHILPIAALEGADSFSLEGGEDGEFDAESSEGVEGGQIGCGFGEPHSFGKTVETRLEIADAPEDLGLFVALVGEREDRVIIGLGDGGTMTGEAGLALEIGIEDRLVDIRGIILKPGEEGGAEVKADAGIVIDDISDAIVTVQQAGEGIGRVAFGGDAFVPVVIRVGGVLELDGFEPCVFPGRLVEMAMDADELTHEWEWWKMDVRQGFSMP